MFDIEGLKFYIEGTHNVTCEIIDKTKTDSQINILVDNLTAQLQTDIEDSISEFLGENIDTLPIVWDRQNYIETQQTIILTKDDIARNCLDVSFNDVTMQMFPKKDMIKMLKAKKVIYRVYTDNEDIPYISRTLKDRG